MANGHILHTLLNLSPFVAGVRWQMADVRLDVHEPHKDMFHWLGLSLGFDWKKSGTASWIWEGTSRGLLGACCPSPSEKIGPASLALLPAPSSLVKGWSKGLGFLSVLSSPSPCTRQPCTLRFGSTSKVPARCPLKY